MNLLATLQDPNRRAARLLVWVMLVGCAATAGARGAETLNAMCPVMTDQPADPALIVVYQGKKVAFCCSVCVNRFKADPERYLDRLPQFGGSGPIMSAQSGADDSGGAEEVVALPGRLHPVIVHFPVAGFPIALVGWLLFASTGKPAFALADVPGLALAVVGSVAAYLTGQVAHEAMNYGAETESLAQTHATVSLVVMIAGLALAGLRIWRRRTPKGAWRWAYGAGLALACGLVGYTGFLGGSLVFGPDHLRW
jgi:uncharacterized membrane protein/YHS domain-containing protein